MSGPLPVVAWLPAHPAMGWVSMNRCWQALDRQAAISPPTDFHITCPLSLPRVDLPQQSVVRRFWARNASYPFQVKRMRSVELVHVLDHSFADLLEWVAPSVKKVVTVHDVIPLIDPSGLSTAQVNRFRRRLSYLQLADRVLCDSAFTMQKLLEHLRLDERRIAVLPIGSDLQAEASGKRPRSDAAPRLLVVGSNLERKNLQILPEMLQHLRNLGTQPIVVRVGPRLPEALRQAIASVNGENHLIELGMVSDEALENSYREADALFFPSKLEGFGLPVIEAMALGCPVVCSDTASLPEVGGRAALYFDPQDASAAARQCHEALTNEGTRRRLIAAGLEQAANLTWSKHWMRLTDIYREVMSA